MVSAYQIIRSLANAWESSALRGASVCRTCELTLAPTTETARGYFVQLEAGESCCDCPFDSARTDHCLCLVPPLVVARSQTGAT